MDVLPYYTISQDANDGVKTWKLDPEVSIVVDAIEHAIKRKNEIGEDSPKHELANRYPFKAAVKDYCTYFPLTRSTILDSLPRRTASILKICDHHSKPKWYCMSSHIHKPNVLRTFSFCNQLCDLLAYCQKCAANPIFFVLTEDDRSMRTHIVEHEWWKRDEVTPLKLILKGHTFPPGTDYGQPIRNEAGLNHDFFMQTSAIIAADIERKRLRNEESRSGSGE